MYECTIYTYVIYNLHTYKGRMNKTGEMHSLKKAYVMNRSLKYRKDSDKSAEDSAGEHIRRMVFIVGNTWDAAKERSSHYDCLYHEA